MSIWFQNNVFISLLKKYTNIDKKFIDTFFKKFRIGHELDFDINENKVAEYLGIESITLRKRLLNIYSKSKKFIENVDYVKIKSGKFITYMLNYQCFEKLAMTGDSEKSEAVREYFIKLREFLVENQHLFYQAIEQKQGLKKYDEFDSIYFFVVDERYPDIIKLGQSGSIIKRLNNYNVGRIKEIELKYFAVVKNKLLIEKCLKLQLESKRFHKYREIFQVTPKKLKKIIDECYCKHVSKKENTKLYKEIATLLGLYSYSKDKINIKPYVIIGKDL
jgi:phage anti-repressor protein